MAKVDIGGAKPVEGDSISEIYYPSNIVTLYNSKSGKTKDRTLKTMEPWELVDLLGGTEVFASYVLDADRGAVGWIRRSLIRGVIQGIDPKDPGPWSLVQMVYHPHIPEPYRPRGDSGLDWAFTTPLTVAETWEILNAREPVIRPARPAKPPRPVPDAARIRKALGALKPLAGIADRVLAAARPQVHLVATRDSDGASSFLLDLEGQKGLTRLAVIDLAGLDDRLGLPSDGSLVFTRDARSKVWGDKPSHALRSSVEYSELSAADVGAAERERAIPLTVVFGVGLPSVDSTDGEAIGFETDGQEVAYVNLLTDLYGDPGSRGGVPGTWLGGYPYQLQDDMQEQCAEMAKAAWGIDSEPAEWRLLLQLASEPAANMSWGDNGFLYYWIRESDLAARDFSHVWCILQTT